MMRAGHMECCPQCGSLRETRPASIEAQALALLATDLEGVPEDCWRFFRSVWAPAPGHRQVRDLAADLSVHRVTLAGRLANAGLPSPKRYLVTAMLTRAARLFELPGFTQTRVAVELGASSHNAFARTLRDVLGLTATQFRQQYDGARMLEHFRAELILPYRRQLRAFSPLLGIGMQRPAKGPRLVRAA